MSQKVKVQRREEISRREKRRGETERGEERRGEERRGEEQTLGTGAEIHLPPVAAGGAASGSVRSLWLSFA